MLVHSIDSVFNIRNPVVTIGTFDGVHLGHRAVISHLKNRAGELNGESVVITFFPHPRRIVPGLRQPFSLLTTYREKLGLLEKAGIDHLIILDFDKELSMMEACDFVETVLVKKIGAKHLVIGFNHHFGRKGAGDYETIKQCAGKFRLSADRVDPVRSGSGTISSSAIRDHLLAGRLAEANSMLGYDYFIDGEVVEGKKLGRKLGFPTANVRPADTEKLVPCNGVYAVEVMLGKETFKGVMSIGKNPTVNRDEAVRTIEANIFNFDRDIYGEDIRVILRFWLRNELVFASLAELSEQIDLDKRKAISLLG